MSARQEKPEHLRPQESAQSRAVLIRYFESLAFIPITENIRPVNPCSAR